MMMTQRAKRTFTPAMNTQGERISMEPSVIVRNWQEWAVLIGLVALAVSAAKWEKKLLIALAIVCLASTICIREVALPLVVRSVIKKRHASGFEVEDYRAGAVAVEQQFARSGRFTLVGGLGLALVAVALARRRSGW